MVGSRVGTVGTRVGEWLANGVGAAVTGKVGRAVGEAVVPVGDNVDTLVVADGAVVIEGPALCAVGATVGPAVAFAVGVTLV